MIHDIVIIGGGPSGMTAALYALRSGAEVLILEKENFGGQIANSPRVENFPTIKEISGLELSDKLFTQITELGANFELEEASHIEKNNGNFLIKCKSGAEFEAKKVIIATGVSHRKMNLPKEDDFIGKGISFCATCDGPFYKGQEVNVIGDANSALQYALALANYCPKVHIFTLFDKFFGDQILIDRIKNSDKFVVTHNVNLIEYQGVDSLEGLVFENSQDKTKIEIKTNNVFICIGQLPHNDCFTNLVDLEKGYILVDENMMSKTEGLYAVGDTRKKTIRQVVTACNDGAVAAIHACRNLY